MSNNNDGDPLSHEEQMQLMEGINRLSQTDMASVIEILRESGLVQGDDIDLDVAALDLPTQRRLYQYVITKSPPEKVDRTAANDDPTTNYCPKGHELVAFGTDHDRYTCNLCNIPLTITGARMSGCRLCDWDVCESCAVDETLDPIHLALNSSNDRGPPPQRIRDLCESFPQSLQRRDVSFGELPIHTACASGWEDVVQILFEAWPGAALIADDDGKLPFHVAVESKLSQETISMLQVDK